MMVADWFDRAADAHREAEEDFEDAQYAAAIAADDLPQRLLSLCEKWTKERVATGGWSLVFRDELLAVMADGDQ